MSPELEIISAQVVLRSASGKRSVGQITSDNVRELLPSPDAIAQARKAFTEAGFEVGGVVANSFSISGPKKTFNKLFKLPRPKRGIATPAGEADAAGYELPLTGLKPDVAAVIEVVTMPPPPDFGPKNY